MKFGGNSERQSRDGLAESSFRPSDTNSKRWRRSAVAVALASISLGMVVNAKPAAAAFRDNPGSWGLDRTDQRSLPLDSDYVYRNLGSGVKVYVVDSGVNADHREFQDLTRPGLPTRVQEGYNAVSFEPPTPFLGGNFDCDGHG